MGLVLLLSSCKERQFHNLEGEGRLVFGDITVDCTAVETASKAGAGTDDFTVIVYDSQDVEVFRKTWSEIKSLGGIVVLDAGDYSMVVRSQAEDVPAASFDHPVYGTTAEFNIQAGQDTSLGVLECSLMQVLVDIGYSEEFLASISGEGKVTVAVDEDYPLGYEIHADRTYETRTGYFAASQTTAGTMIVKFSGSFDGKPSKMSRAFEGIKAGQHHKIVFAKKETDEGNATIIIGIDDLLDDGVLDSDQPAKEESLGDDPDAPAGDGGIEMVSTCIYDLSEIITVPADGEPFVLTMQVKVPNKVNKFTVSIESDNPLFTDSVKMINDGSTVLDLVNPTAGAISVFTDILPFPYGDEVRGKELIDFDLSDAQTPINAFAGNHKFIMTVIDRKGCRKSIPVEMYVPSAETASKQ